MVAPPGDSILSAVYLASSVAYSKTFGERCLPIEKLHLTQSRENPPKNRNCPLNWNSQHACETHQKWWRYIKWLELEVDYYGLIKANHLLYK